MSSHPLRGRKTFSVRSQILAISLVIAVGVLLSVGGIFRAIPVAHADTNPQTLPFTQAWTNIGLITADDNWSGVPGVIGYRGDDLTAVTGTDPQTIVADGSATPVDVTANQTNPDVFNTGGVAEFHITNPVVALNGSGTADAPHIVITLNTTGLSGITAAYNLRDIDGSVDNSIQPVALQYRVGGAGNYTNIAAGFVADASGGPSQATLVTPVSVTLPAACDNQANVQLRIMTTNAVGNDEWIGMDDINISVSGAPTPPTGVGLATPGSVLAGGASLLTVTVTPGANPPSTGITVVGDLTLIGNSPTQAFLDDGLNGDVTAGDNIFSYNAIVAPMTTIGLKLLPFTVADAQVRSSGGNISLNIQSPPVSIHVIQGSGSTSPLVGQVVATSGIVTGLRSNGFFIQEPAPDADPATSEGIFVFTSSAPPASAVIGNSVGVMGTVAEFIPTQDLFSPPVTELVTPTVSANSTGNPLPAPITLTAADLNVNNINNLEKFEGMRVHVNSLTTISPTQGTINEPNATVTSNGVFYGVLTGTPRPFREPGIQTPDPVPTPVPSPNNVPIFDANPEKLRVDSDAQPGTTALDVTTGVVVTNLTGPLDYSFRTYTILPDAATPPSVTSNLSPTPVPPQTFNEFTVGSFNMQRFFDTVDDPGTSDPVLTPTAFNKRLGKSSLVIRNYTRSPDVIGVTELENLTTLQAVATQINNDTVAAGLPNPNYQAYLSEGNDIGGIDVGFLIKSSRVSVVDVTQFGLATTYINPNNGQPELLNDRPPLVARVTVPQPCTGIPMAFTIIINHLRSLSGVDDPVDGNRIRTKRRAQAEYLANLIQARQVANPTERIVTIGDYNAFQFNDGFGDSIGTIMGVPTPPDQVVQASPDLVNPDLTDLIDFLPPNEQYSYSFDGNAQALDHELVNDDALAVFSRLAYARIDADFPTKYFEDGLRPERLSDHDPAVAYFRVCVRTDAADFDGDGKADLSVFRPSNSVWYISNSGGASATPFGLGSDRIVPGDYDGDGKTDIAVFRNGDWYLLQSANGIFFSRHFGSAGDIPASADYDNDGRADFAVFRPTTGTWYIERSSDFVQVTQRFGTDGDLPVPGDYNGDGSADIALWRPSNGTWYTSLDPGTNFGAVQFGLSDDSPVQADYDGDGRTDIAVYRPSNGTWYLLQSTNGFRTEQFGLSTDVAVPADYDGDGQVDVAVFRDGDWHIRATTGNGRTTSVSAVNQTYHWGQGGDKPAPAAYVPEQ